MPTIARARGETVEPVERGDNPGQFVIARLDAVEKLSVVLERDAPLGVEHVDRPHSFGLVTPPDLEIVEVVRRRDLHRAGALFRVGIFVGDQRNEAADQRQAQLRADPAVVALVVGMHGDRRVAEHRLWPRCGDSDDLALVLERIVEVIEVAVRVLRQRFCECGLVQRLPGVARPFERALALDLLNLEVGDRGLEPRVPVDEPLVAIHQPLAVQLHEHLGDRLRQPLVQSEALAAPVARGAEALELADDGAAGFGLPLPNLFQEGGAAHRATIHIAALGELAFDNHLRGDAGVIGARLPQHVAALHAPVTAQDILQRVVERVAHVQVAGDVGRRDDDAEWLGVGPLGAAGAERARLLPKRADAALNGGEIEGLIHAPLNDERPRKVKKPGRKGSA